jgi:hypothetical protein
MSSKNYIPFHFHADGHALSGEFTRPFKHLIDAQASTSLPTIGGQSRALVEDFKVQEHISFRRGYSNVSGSKRDDGIYDTHATAVVEQLNVLDVITADKIVARLSSEHHVGEREGHIIAVGSKFENLRIAGYEVKIELYHDLFLRNKKFEDLRKHCEKDKDARSTVIAKAEGVVLCSLVKSIETNAPGVEVRGNAIIVPHFGKIFVAEVLAEHGTRTLTMMRLELGSPHVANITVSESRTNGQPMPPAGPN